VVESRFQRFMRAAGPLPFVGLLALLGLAFALAAHRADKGRPALTATVADLKPVHAGVLVAGERVTWLRRMAAGERVLTDADGRARLRLDNGMTAVVDHDTRVSTNRHGLTLEAGRLHVTSPQGSASEIVAGGLTVLLSGASAGLDHRGDNVSAYAIDGELTVRGQGKEARVNAGQTAHFSGGELKVSPERAYDDWTHGLARPWAARGTPRRALGELWGVDRSPAGRAGSPLTIRSHRVNAVLERELARTNSETTFFNAGADAVDGDFRVALPPGALVSGFSATRGGVREVAHIALASRTQIGQSQEGGVLEWAGDGWLRGTLSAIPSGQEVTVNVEYTEWLTLHPSGQNSIAEYRYPLIGEGETPRIGEFSARVDAGASNPLTLTSGYGARNEGRAAVFSSSDFRPAADFVVDVEEHRTQGRARLYVAPPEESAPEAGSPILLRTELPPAAPNDGVTLALVVDTSGSIDPALLDVERALVEALLAGLGRHDRVVVLSADQGARAVGPRELGPVDGARRQAISVGLAALSPGGATDLGRALEAAADALPLDAPSALVVYIGDGSPTLGDPQPETILARLARRTSGAPRLAAVATGPLANRSLLAALTRGSGPLFEVADSADSAGVAVELLSDALRPTLTGVEVDFGPEVDQIYPRGARAIPAGETLTVVGRARGEVPRSILLRYRDARGLHEEVRAVEAARLRDPSEVGRRWAAERVEEIVLRGKGREAVTDAALRAGLVTPWTALKLGGGTDYIPSSLEARVLDLGSNGESAVGSVLASTASAGGTLAAEGEKEEVGIDLPSALVAAAGHVIEGAQASVRACRDSRVALRPELSGALLVKLEIDGDGLPHRVSVVGSTSAAEDVALDRCVALVIEGLRFPTTNLATPVKVERLVALPPPPRLLGARHCSAISKLAMPLRRGAWWSRLLAGDPSEVYREAKDQCELGTWTDRRALLGLLLAARPRGLERIELARRLELAGESDAAALIRREAVRRVQTPAELSAVRLALLGDEHFPRTVFEERYKAAANDLRRLEVVTRFLALAPHDSRLRERQIALLLSLGKKPELAELARTLRSDPFAAAPLLCDAASALHRVGFDDEARRTFGELAERAPRDPWVRGLLGDRLRREGWFDDASAAYAALDELMPRDARALLRSALAHAGAGRLDLSARLLTQVSETGGRAGDAALGDLARELGRVLVSEALVQKAQLEPGEVARLRLVLRELSQAETNNVVLLRAEAGAPELRLSLETGSGPLKEARAPDLAAPSLGLYLYRVSGEGDPLFSRKLRASRPAELAPAAPTTLRIESLFGAGSALPTYRYAELVLPSDGKTVELKE
jgi:Mg-chelatase subunit ChlD